MSTGEWGVIGETWMPITDYEGRYEVSSHGRVRSLDRKDAVGRRLPGRMKRQTGRYGYLTVGLTDGRGQILYSVHRIVNRAFNGEPAAGQVTRHLDGNPANNHYLNLAWGTQSQNMLDSVAHGTHNMATRTHCPRKHPLSVPNLRKRRDGCRRCLACHYALNAVRYNPARDVDHEADRYYELIAGGYFADN